MRSLDGLEMQNGSTLIEMNFMNGKWQKKERKYIV